MSGEEAFRKLPPEEQAARRALGEAMMKFLEEAMNIPAAAEVDPETGSRPLEIDRPMLEYHREIYRQALDTAASHGIEVSLCWHTIATWTNDGKERIGYFARALDCLDREAAEAPAKPDPRGAWSQTHTRADSLFEIGRVHAAEGDPGVARDFLERALPLAREAVRLRVPAGIGNEDTLIRKIADLEATLPKT